MYRNLDPAAIVRTVAALRRRIDDRFPDSGLSKVAVELLDVANEARQRAKFIARPHFALRGACVIAVVLTLAVLAGLLAMIKLEDEQLTWVTLVQLVESGLNDLVLLGAGLFFLITLETRIKRRRAMQAIHELRSLAHVIDMHQLTKDPQALLGEGPATQHSPERVLSPYELARYLDYCSEMLSLVGKMAALYVEKFDDSVALAAVDSIEDLTTGLSRKIWQKITLLESHAEPQT
ncbi:MAG: hypothetical protein H7A49_13710 [Akkermansiaceae bacterium]|nr:hypothetical protein [Akkermansiaceae bacterium]MCP5547660.1 hypothetical protein [Akkermansiaceae bacterium]